MTRLASAGSSFANVVAYKVGWLACVLGAAAGWGTLGAGVAFLLVLAHLGLAERPDREWPLLLAAAAIGIVTDTLHAALGVLDFRGHEAGTMAPAWIIALWLQFGTLLHFAMRWLSRRYFAAAVLGLFGGPMASLAGERLGAATFGEPRAVSLVVLGLSWSLVLPVLVLVADRLSWAGRYRLFSPSARGRGPVGGGGTAGTPAAAARAQRAARRA